MKTNVFDQFGYSRIRSTEKPRHYHNLVYKDGKIIAVCRCVLGKEIEKKAQEAFERNVY